jgi:pyruvate/2-oxoglutarate dehydrogenase complex dihydrolipoamide dehydrogenase (E3) component
MAGSIGRSKQDNAECAQLVIDALLCEGVAIRAGASVRSVQQTSDSVELAVKCGDADDRTTGSHLLIAAERLPRVEGLGLEEANVVFTPAASTRSGTRPLGA